MDKDYEKFIVDINKHYNFNLDNYKDNQMYRRLKSFYEKKECKNFKEYFELIKKDKKEEYDFFDKITINVTEFYRNRERWGELRKIIEETEKKELKILSAACSTGEEVYTLRMLGEELGIKIEIKGIDIDDKSLKKAKEGMYSEMAMKGLTKGEITKYFKKETLKNENYEEEKYVFRDEYRNGIKFEKKDMLNERLDKEYDIIVCRNVMIYFKEEAKEELYLKFNESLKKDGILYVGSSEQIFKPENYGFEILKPFFYKKK